MTLVNTATGEIIDAPTEAEIRASIRRVIDHAESIWDEWAWQVENQTWHVLGYASWDEMRRGEYGALTSVAAPRAERPELVARFRNAGLTQRQTADTLGISQATVNNHDEPTYKPRASNIRTDIRPEPAEIVDAELVEDETPTLAEQAASDDEAAELDADVVPIRPAPSAPRRSPLTDSFFRTVHETARRVESLHRLVEDDRWPQNAEKVASAHRGDLLRINDLFQQVINALPTEESTQ